MTSLNLLNSLISLLVALSILIKLYNKAKELGVYEKVRQDGGWGNVSAKDCGSMVSKAIEIANRKV